MAEIGGTTYGIVTGVTYGTLLFSSSALCLLLVNGGPVGWVSVALLAIDGIAALIFSDYDGIIAMAINAQWVFYSAKQYPGTKYTRKNRLKRSCAHKY
jgi:hypothetical protein